MIIENETHAALQKPFANTCTLVDSGFRFECGQLSNLGMEVTVWTREHDAFGKTIWVIDGKFFIDPIRKGSRSVRPADVLNAYHNSRY